MLRASSVRPEPMRPANPTISPLRTVKEMSCSTSRPAFRLNAVHPLTRRTSSSTTAWVRGGYTLSISRPTMFLMSTASLTSPLRASRVQMVWPSRSTVTTSATLITSLSLWVMRTQVTPCSFSSLRMEKRLSQSVSFRAAVGSSRTSSLTLRLIALAISTSCCLPTPRSFTSVSGLTSSLTLPSISVACLIVSFQSTVDRRGVISWPRKMFSYTVISGTRASSW